MRKKQGDAYQLKAYNKWYVYLGILLLVLVHPYKTYAILNNVGSGGNAPTLLKGDLILADNFQYTGTVIPQRGDHIIFKYPEDETKDFLKRVIGLPGDVLEIKNREVWINEQQLREP